MGKKIVILFEVNPVVTYAGRYDFNTLIGEGYSLDICNLSGLVSDYYITDGGIQSSDKITNYCFKNKNDFKRYVNDLDEDVFIWSTFQLTAEYYWIFKLISKKHYGFICNIDYVFPRSKSRMAKKSFWTKWSWHRIKNAVLYRVPRRMIPIRKADAVITYGYGDVQRKLNNVLYDDHTIIELTNTIDYNECIKTMNNSKADPSLDLPERYILFIDEYMPYHPDGLKLGMFIDGTNYYQEVEAFLNRVSKLTKLPVIIAAHPKADYKLHSECYHGMRIIQFHTPELISKAHLVITHISIAISMILICRKPFILITTDDIKRVIHRGGITEDQERDLKCKAINISENLSDEYLYKIIDKALDMDPVYYREQVLKYKLPDEHPNESLSFGEILIKTMKRVEAGESEKV